MEPKSKAKQIKWNLVSPIGCYKRYFHLIVTNQLAIVGDNLVGIGDKRKRMVVCNVWHRGSNFASYRKIADFLLVLMSMTFVVINFLK
jgi:hypothetical protein